MVYAKDREWVIWSNEGLFSSSSNGHLLLNIDAALLPLYRKPELLANKITAPQHFHSLAAAELQDDKSVFNAPAVTLIKPPLASQQQFQLTAPALLCIE